jgi:hypothetical protein
MVDYTEPFDVDAPADTDLISDGDDAIRQLKRALKEMLETFFVSIGDNPLVPISQAKIFTGLLELSSVQSTLAAGGFKEFDVDVAGSKVGDLAYAEYNADDVYPTDADTPPDTAGVSGINGRDYVHVRAWCLNDDKVRVRMVNPSGVGVGGIDGIKIRAWTVQAGVPPV